MKYIIDQEWRYATKKFDPNKKISKENIDLIKRAVQLSVSSYGLQTYKVLIIKNHSIREQLKPASWNQSQITDASHVIVFCNYTQVAPQVIDDYINLTAKTRKLDIEVLKGYGDFMKMKVSEKSPEEICNWTKNQTYIALANLLSVCASLEIDACPMEGFEAEQYNKILGLTEKGLNASVIATIGYRSNEDESQYLKKVRKPIEHLFEDI
ncbi:NAD(P)H-dependent oxidoreductase [Aquimarina sp. D1M17]|uniref:NAD(P)H-dependent oxidoreductase n=1 Tax=Aquimarina acroporae TaxID=2937283 RepID=UPI0020BFE698|nr:NAD(P)H-dependent oxidoreductase [Aquimarina acroporae]MCK8521498.1 NAD(P)H-dependent oxidoreductase [Aquimarina acroporae]